MYYISSLRANSLGHGSSTKISEPIPNLPAAVAILESFVIWANSYGNTIGIPDKQYYRYTFKRPDSFFRIQIIDGRLYNPVERSNF